MTTTGIILAGGKGTRFGSEMPKQFLMLFHKPVICYSIEAFEKSDVDDIVLVVGEEFIPYMTELVAKEGYKKVKAIVSGGAERYISGHNGILAAEGDCVLIHDGARPLIKPEIINEHVRLLSEHHALITAERAVDTIKVADEAGYVVDTPDRRNIWQAQTPQSFNREELLLAYEKMMCDIAEGDMDPDRVTDDAFIWEHYADEAVFIVDNPYVNKKITKKSDLILVEFLIENKF